MEGDIFPNFAIACSVFFDLLALSEFEDFTLGRTIESDEKSCNLLFDACDIVGDSIILRAKLSSEFIGCVVILS